MSFAASAPSFVRGADGKLYSVSPAGSVLVGEAGHQRSASPNVEGTPGDKQCASPSFPGDEMASRQWVWPGEELSARQWVWPGEELSARQWVWPGEELSARQWVWPGEELSARQWVTP